MSAYSISLLMATVNLGVRPRPERVGRACVLAGSPLRSQEELKILKGRLTAFGQNCDKNYAFLISLGQ